MNTKGVGVNRPGAFAEYISVPAFNVFKLPDVITDDMASILDPFGNATHTAPINIWLPNDTIAQKLSRSTPLAPMGRL